MLPDFDSPGWWAPRLVMAVGALLLLWRPSRLGFALCLVGGLWPLLFLRDVLTQSTYLAACAALGLVGARDTRAAVVWLTGGTYLLAGFHKLNSGFIDMSYSCADHAWVQVMNRWPVPDLAPASPWLGFGLEVVLGLAVLRRSPWRWPLALLFHLPLTVTLAPAFGPVMLSGLVAAGSAREAVLWRRVWRTRKRWLAGAGVVLAGLDFVFARPESVDVLLVLKVAAAGALLVGCVFAWSLRRAPPLPRRWVAVVVALWIANGLTPYLGWQYQHTAAMLSNMRIDEGCHNHLLMPAWLVAQDPYIRIDEASIGGRTRREKIVRETLWNVPALHTMRRNWCIPENRPIRFVGTWRGDDFSLPDLCADDWLDSLPGADGRLPGMQLFQKNLRRTCPTACVH